MRKGRDYFFALVAAFFADFARVTTVATADTAWHIPLHLLAYFTNGHVELARYGFFTVKAYWRNRPSTPFFEGILKCAQYGVSHGGYSKHVH